MFPDEVFTCVCLSVLEAGACVSLPLSDVSSIDRLVEEVGGGAGRETSDRVAASMAGDVGKGGQCSSVSPSSSLRTKSACRTEWEPGPVYSITPSTGNDVNTQQGGRDDGAMTSQAPQCACAVAANTAERGPVRAFRISNSTEAKSRHHRTPYQQKQFTGSYCSFCERSDENR